MTTLIDRIRNRDPIPEAKARWLGRAGGFDYCEHGGREYAVTTRPVDLESFTSSDGERLLARQRTELLPDGERLVTTVHHRAWPVATGSYAKLAKKRKPDGEKPMRVWDRLATLPLMQRREPMRLATGPVSSMLDRLPSLPSTSEQEQQAIAGALNLADRNRSLIEVGGNTPPERSVAGMVAYLQGRGVELELARGRLVARSRDPMRSDLRDLIEQAEELIVGQLQGKPVMCSTCAEPAVTIVFPHAPMCQEHAAQ